MTLRRTFTCLCVGATNNHFSLTRVAFAKGGAQKQILINKFLSVTRRIRQSRLFRCCVLWIAGLLTGLFATSVAAPAHCSENSLPANGQDGTPALSAQATTAPNSPAQRVDVLSVVIGGMTAPKAFYLSFNIFLGDNLRSFTKGGGTVRTEFVFTGPHVFQLWSHAARVKAGKEDAFSSSTKKKVSRIMRTVVDPFLADHPGGQIVLGGHSFGTVEMECLKVMVEKKYGKQVVVAAYALAPVARRLDNDVAVVSARRDFMVFLSDLLYPGRAVRGTPVTVPVCNHFLIHMSPNARKVLAEYFAFVSSQLRDPTDRSE
jgi:hypothetical protein